MSHSLALTPTFLNYLMTEALAQAALAAAAQEVPVGAVVALGETIIGRGHNTTEASSSVVSHAELHALHEASGSLNNWRLSDCVLCVTLEPCTMCLGALRLSRIPVVVFGAGDSKQGAVGSLYDLSQDDRLGAPLRVVSGIMRTECEQQLKDFFLQRRS